MQLECVIRGDSRKTQEKGVHPTLVYFPMTSYEVAAEHAHDKGTLICKFENLVGPSGGGNVRAQREEVKKLLSFLDISFDEEKLEGILGNLFGGTKTFSCGQIGGWKKAFNFENRKLFKKRCSHLLTTFDYPF
ncbi:MAG: hypothetical protein KDK76_01905 [Chlamydiia bacterium]|nr:hypothetical protein [Chlamydiia bacterium]